MGVEYDGNAYNGWQKQNVGIGIQTIVEQSISEVANSKTEIVCAGRTDAGVHARGQIIHYDTDAKRTNYEWQTGVNSHLPDDININVAVKNSDDKTTFYYQKKLSQLTTINKEIANQRMQGHIKQMEIKSNKLTTIINNTKYKNRKIDFLNIDLEGADFEALQSLDFNIYRPKLICVEIYDDDIEKSNINIFLKDLEYTRKWSATFSHLYTDNLTDFN